MGDTSQYNTEQYKNPFDSYPLTMAEGKASSIYILRSSKSREGKILAIYNSIKFELFFSS